MKKIISNFFLIFIVFFLPFLFELIFRPAYQIEKIISQDEKKINFILKKKNKTINGFAFKDQIKNDLKIKDWVIVEKTENNQYLIVDIYRTDKLIFLLSILIAGIIFIIKKGFLKSISALFLSYFVIFTSILPNIFQGYDPLIVVFVGILILTPINYYLAHGFNLKTQNALISNLIINSFAFLINIYLVKWLKLTGLTEEANFINFFSENKINFQHLYIASINIGIYASLDDIAITQSSIVETLLKNKIEKTKIFNQAIEIGIDHINSIINTIFLIFTSTSFPLLLLYFYSGKNFIEATSYEILSMEIFRIISTTFFIILSVPLTTKIAIINSRSIK